MAMAQRFDDRRRTKWKAFDPINNKESFTEQLLQELEQRPVNKFMVGDIVFADNAYREIQMKYFSSGHQCWMYRFSESRYYSFNVCEMDINPLFYKQGDKLPLPSGAERKIAYINLSSSNTPRLIFEVRPKHYTIYTYDEILEAAPPSDFSLLKFLWDSLRRGKLSQEYCKKIVNQIKPELTL